MRYRSLLSLPGKLLLITGLLIQFSFCHSQTKLSDVAGVWEGHLYSFGQQIRLVYKISVSEDNKLSVLYDSPDYPLVDVPVSEAELEGNRLYMSVGSFTAVYEGTVGDGIIRGRYSGGGIWLPLNLRRRSANPRFLLDYMVPRMTPAGERILSYKYTPPEQKDDGWDVGDAHNAGLDTNKINSLMRRILAGDFPNLHSVLVVKDGTMLIEEYFYGFHRDKTHQIASISKVIPAAAAGIAIDRGMIEDLHIPLSQFFPEYYDLLATGEKSSLTLYHLLTMTTGLKWDEHAVSYLDPRNDLSVMKMSPDPIRNLFERPLVSRPGERFVYNSGCIIALEEILQRVTKSHFLVFSQNELFTPLGISNYRWDDGYQMIPRDMAKLGWLFQCGGEYNGARILSTAWIDSVYQLYERPPRKYFNHWWPTMYFVNRVPIKSLVAGGWGGQSITIVPTLNTIIVLTAANQMEPADYDVCIRDYILPAILTPEYVSKYPDFKYTRIKEAQNLEWDMRWDSEMGCLKASVKSLGLSITDSRLYGGTGFGFLINIDERAEAKSMAVWNKHRMYELCRNLGFEVEAVWSHKSNKDFAATQKLVWDLVRREIDSGNACYGFHLASPIRYLIAGYDDRSYYYKGGGAEHGAGPVYWDDLGQTDIGLLGMHFVRPAPSDVPFREMVKSAFQFVLEFSANSGQWVPENCKAGPEGYTRWISLIEAGREDKYGFSYNAALLAEGRRFAVEFLEESKSELGPEFSALFDRAILHYRRAAQNLEIITEMFPHSVISAKPPEGLYDSTKRQAAIRHLRTVRDAEMEGLKVLAEIAEKL